VSYIIYTAKPLKTRYPWDDYNRLGEYWFGKF